jgi:diaminopimelate decarboxylase
VGPIKTVPIPGGTRTYVSVDGGLSDNPRPALYESRYTIERVDRPSPANKLVTISGKHCESDTLFRDVAVPEDLQTGELVQVLCTGAYNSSMASNYNRYQRPATALIREDGSFDLIQERETWDEMFGRERVPKDLKA